MGIEKGFSARYRNVDDYLQQLVENSVTSIQTYVLWKDVEPDEGMWNFDRFDRDLEPMRRAGIRWVPFLIAGPWYSTPDWFLNSPESQHARCLEHHQETGCQSIWNTSLWPRVEKFLSAFQRHYSPDDIESVLLGVTGDYGEAIYPVIGNWPGEYHSHTGYWCGEPGAVEAFRRAISHRYGTVAELNRTWGSHYRNWEEVRPFLRSEAPSNMAWLALIDWYRESMLAYTARWLGKARQLWPEQEVYLCTGGDMAPPHGSDFSRQAQLAARYGAGVRITNEGSDFMENLLLTRLVTVSAQFYGGYAGIEPAATVTPRGVAIRMLNATGSGARQLHEYFANLFEETSEGAVRPKPESWAVWQANGACLRQRTPVYLVALAISNTELTLNEQGLTDPAVAGTAESLRNITDFALVDESLIRDGLLSRLNPAVVVLAGAGARWSPQTLLELEAFAANGGAVLSAGVPRSVETLSDPSLTWTGTSPDTIVFKGFTRVTAAVADPFWQSAAPSLLVSTSVSRLSDAAEVLLKTAYQPAGEETLAVLWRVRRGTGAFYFYTGSFAVNPRSWTPSTSILAVLLRYLENSGQIRHLGWEPNASVRTIATHTDRIRLTCGDILIQVLEPE